ncbi:hypothetical protein AXG93_1543s1320 [Marchantia polymorpha subsp. ruderalis]|uniref:Uncharacterized protein n=1 Tax=Marchantia polymorpha subsp. ruderalis TaxID=1480154 RepID=A0A176VZ68_MARPO|nr:hypothetical protein AXG93_1543s1320 [Marchantia polymorpha subsp. ruderalis]
MAHLEGNHTKRCRMPLLVELRTRGQVEDKSLISCASRYILEYASPPTADLDSPVKRKLLKRAAIRISLRAPELALMPHDSDPRKVAGTHPTIQNLSYAIVDGEVAIRRSESSTDQVLSES